MSEQMISDDYSDPYDGLEDAHARLLDLQENASLEELASFYRNFETSILKSSSHIGLRYEELRNDSSSFTDHDLLIVLKYCKLLLILLNYLHNSLWENQLYRQIIENILEPRMLTNDAKDLSADIIASRYRGKIFGYAIKRGFSSEEAKMFVQDVLIVLFRRIERYEGERVGPSAGRGWIWRLVRNEFISHIRAAHQNLDTPLLLEEWDPAQESEDPDEVGLQRESRDRTAAARLALAELTPDERDVVERGRGPGAGRREYWPVLAKVKPIFERYYKRLTQGAGDG